MDLYDRFEKYRSYLFWFLVPLGCVHALNFASDVIVLGKFFAMLAFVAFIILFFLGMALNLISRLPSYDDFYTKFFKTRLNKYVPMFYWGHRFVDWMMETQEEEKE